MRGTVCEMFRPEWGLGDPVAHVYHVTIRPGVIKAWQKHLKQDDRIFVVRGSAHIVLYDDRPDSPTRGMLNEVFISDQNRATIVFPAGVFHGVRNLGNDDLLFVNMPTRAYDYEDPDKYRLPVENDYIPYRFDGGPCRG
jgi:dTDP-4-dehydrorhamnose 3,5-epimerase